MLRNRNDLAPPHNVNERLHYYKFLDYNTQISNNSLKKTAICRGNKNILSSMSLQFHQLPQRHNNLVSPLMHSMRMSTCPVLSDVTNTYSYHSTQKKSLVRKESQHQADCYSEHSTNEDTDLMSSQELLLPPIVLQSSSSCVLNESENNQNEALNSTLKKPKKKATDETKFKTELCKNWSETGRCNYGNKCKFAHGKEELLDRPIPNKQRYKSKRCNSFHTGMFCPYGLRCLFAHEQNTLEEVNGRSYYQRLLEIPELLETPTNASRRLSFFQKLTEQPTKPSFDEFACFGYGLYSKGISSVQPIWECTETFTMELQP